MTLSNQLKRLCLLFSAALLLSINLYSQTKISITGIVSDESGEPVIGASVLLPGTTVGTITGLDGSYSLSGI